ncbi:MAG: hypothetical protein ABI162_18245 [Luteolibacter sp.]
MNANPSHTFGNTNKAEQGKTKRSAGLKSTGVFKHSLNIGSFNEQDRLVVQALLRQLVSSSSSPPQS